MVTFKKKKGYYILIQGINSSIQQESVTILSPSAPGNSIKVHKTKIGEIVRKI